MLPAMSGRARGLPLTADARSPYAWIVVAHVVGAAAIGALDAARVGGAGVALAVVPIFAATGVIAGATIAAGDRVAAGRRWWVAALVLALPTLVISIPLAATLFDGAYARTLWFARAAPIALPVATCVAAAVAIAIGRRVVRDGALVARAIVVLALAGAAGAIVHVERHVLRSGYADAHIGATLALVVVVGLAVRVARRASVPAWLAGALAGVALGTAAAACGYGLRAPDDRARVVALGDQSKDLVHLWRALLDYDRDGYSALLGGGDCDDFDARIHPGAIDIPGDGIDQDCDGADAVAAPRPPPPPRPLDLASWRASPAVRAVLDRTRSMNVVLITVDALRLDLLAPGAPDRADFPNLTALVDRSVWFARAIAPASGTDISLSTLLTGRHDPYQPVDATLVEAMRGRGRHTYAAIPGEVTRFVGDVLIGRGVDHFTTVHTDWNVQDVGDHVSAGATTAEGVKALADGGPVFVWLHYFDVHEHLQIGDVPRELYAAVHDGGSPVAHKYRALLRAIDDGVGKLVAELAARHLDDRTIIVFASDHGESLGEDPRLPDTHGDVVYAPLVRVPLAIYVPGVAPGRRDDPVSLVDLAPTLCDLLGAPAAMAPVDGIDLVPALLDAPAALRVPRRAIAIHEEKQWAVVEWPYQLLMRPADDVVELYDLERDPAQHANLARAEPDVVSRLRARFAAAPAVNVDRSPAGRAFREQQARPPPRPLPSSGRAATSTP